MVDRTKNIESNDLLCLNSKDNIGITCRDIHAQEILYWNKQKLTLLDAVGIGHKVSLVCIKSGQKIVKYGVAIGSATVDIPKGSLVHTHNVQSDYIPSHYRSGFTNQNKD